MALVEVCAGAGREGVQGGLGGCFFFFWNLRGGEGIQLPTYLIDD